MTLRSRLTLGLLTIIVILVVPLLVATRSLDRLNDEARGLRDGDFAASLLLSRLRESLNDLRGAEMAVLFVRDEKSRSAMQERVATVSRLSDSLETYQLDSAATAVRSAMQVVGPGATAEYEAGLSGRPRDAERISAEQVVPAISRAEAAVGSAERALLQRTRERVAHAARHAEQGSNIAILGLVLALVVAVLIGLRLTHSVHKPVTELERGMRSIADGDFDATLKISSDRTDEFGRLAASFEEMRRQLAELDTLKTEFVSVASHELKTPINVILGYTQLLQEELYGPLTPKQRNVANVLEAQSRTLSRLVKQLLDVTRFEAGAARLDVRPVDLPKLLDELEQSFRVLADQRGIRFTISQQEGMIETVHWDPDRINEVLGNLLSNAFKFTERGGEVELTVSGNQHHIHMDVRDSGAGIPEDQVHRIFEKFYQADNQNAAAHAGSGLGLSITRQIVEAHKGTISCESTPGVGTTFSIELPERATGRRHTGNHARVTAEVA
jgi:signal transduction histidine kinase